MFTLIHILLKQEDPVPATEAVTSGKSSGVNYQTDLKHTAEKEQEMELFTYSEKSAGLSPA